jgi:ectoine hydroxylase
VHGSAQNMSPFDRRIVLLTYSHVDNTPRETGERRPEFIVSRDFTPLHPLEGQLSA